MEEDLELIPGENTDVVIPNKKTIYTSRDFSNNSFTRRQKALILLGCIFLVFLLKNLFVNDQVIDQQDQLETSLDSEETRIIEETAKIIQSVNATTVFEKQENDT